MSSRTASSTNAQSETTAVPQAATSRYVSVTYHSSTYSPQGNRAPKTFCFPESELQFTNGAQIKAFLKKNFAVNIDGGLFMRIHVSTQVESNFYGSAKPKLPYTAMLSPGMHPELKAAPAWHIYDEGLPSYASSSAPRKPQELDSELMELQRMVIDLKQRLAEKSKEDNQSLKKASRKAEKLFKSYEADLDERFDELEVSLRKSFADVKSKPSISSPGLSKLNVPGEISSLSFKLVDVSAYPLTDGSGLVRVVGRLPSHVGTMLLALNELPEVKNINGEVATFKDLDSTSLNLVALLKFSQWKNEWLCSWDEKAIESVSKPILSRVSSEASAPHASVGPSFAGSTLTSQTLSTQGSSVNKPEDSSTHVNGGPKLDYYVRSVTDSQVVPLSQRAACFRDAPPGLSGAQDEIPWTVKVDTPEKTPDSNPPMNSNSESYICDYCLNVIDNCRYHCEACVDFDVCESCYSSRAKSHSLKHAFVRVLANPTCSVDISSAPSTAPSAAPFTAPSASLSTSTALAAASSSGETSASLVKFPTPSLTSTVSHALSDNGHKFSSDTSSPYPFHSAGTTRTPSLIDFGDILSEADSYEHVTSDVPNFSDFEEHF